ncbi:hypothetical protein [Glycomyces tritici]|uniref:Uncharacterized protein n=1 Tax=Glycomyces tritici TaxID=2665176 RepID=A0ABT7YIQ8_9ACTN|nr:hypothetical protein [Glycomyces tritici]MDN3238524.1 hypothetical protein [Glycomyces tritici]
MPAPEPAEPDRQQSDTPDVEEPILVRPVPPHPWPKAISTARSLTGIQVALVMICGNCSFGLPLLGAIAWVTERLSQHGNADDYVILWTWVVGFAAIVTYAYFTNRWAGRADRRARTTIIIGTAVLVGFTALTIGFVTMLDPQLIKFVLIAAAPSLILQAVVLRCVYGGEGRDWFGDDEAVRTDG